MSPPKSAVFLRNFVAKNQSFFDKSHEQFFYFVGMAGCLFAHISYFIMFYMLGVKEMVYFNIGSILFYIAMLIFVPVLKHERSLLLYFTELEIIAHASYATHIVGWAPDFGMFLLLIISAAFLVHGQRFYMPFIITFLAVGSYNYLKFTITETTGFKYFFEDNSILKTMHIINIFICSFVLVFTSASYLLQRESMEYKLREQNETFKRLASIDPLTQLFNRRAMNENIKAIRRESKSPDTSYVIGIGDIDNFKKINDTYGHDTGDKVLVYVAELFRELIPEKGYAARWGGEEFLFIIPDSAIGDGVEFTEKIHKALRAHVFDIDDCQFGVTMTFGVNTGLPAEKIDSVINRADERLYKGKNNGKNHTEFTD